MRLLYRRRKDKYFIISVADSKQIFPTVSYCYFSSVFTDRVPSALLFQWRIIILLTKFMSVANYQSFHQFNVVGTLWRGASKASLIFKTTLARWNRRIWQGIRRDRRTDGTSCAVFLIREDEDTNEELEEPGFVKYLRFYWTSKWHQSISCLLNKCRILSLFILRSLL